jgi:DNA-directed RNA polymerase subunit alpha
MRKFEKPNFKIERNGETDSYMRFVVEPLEKGYGITLGNALRRVLLSGIPGASVYAIEIDGVPHEFSTIPGIKEDVISIILNLKKLNLFIDEVEDSKKELTIDIKGPKVVTGADIRCPDGVEVLNGEELYLATVAAGASLKMKIYAKNGRGFFTAEQNKDPSSHFGVIPTDSNYSPVIKVAYNVDPTRVGKNYDYDKLTMDVWTDGSMEPQTAMALAAKILMEHLDLFTELTNLDKFTENGIIGPDDKGGEIEEKKDMSIEDLDLSVRSYNCLKRAGITTVSELTQKSEEDMMKVRNLGKKSLKEVKDKLASEGLSFKISE